MGELDDDCESELEESSSGAYFTFDLSEEGIEELIEEVKKKLAQVEEKLKENNL